MIKKPTKPATYIVHTGTMAALADIAASKSLSISAMLRLVLADYVKRKAQRDKSVR